ncbi:MAG: mannose-6-phosphate isomerase-like protein (cupin superfamily) [Gammaproteobacteria bacterium]|jgi:mannose-6-phosphate isomerase-like protein (cupin superfamily)
MSIFATNDLARVERVLAPDGSSVYSLLSLAAGGMACFELGAGLTSRAVVHRTVEELWFVRAGRGQIWRKQNDVEETTPLSPGVCISIPVATHFQFRASQHCALSIVGVTMPPWPGQHEALVVSGAWPVTL